MKYKYPLVTEEEIYGYGIEQSYDPIISYNNTRKSWGMNDYITQSGKRLSNPRNLTELLQFTTRDDVLLYITEVFNREFFSEYIPDLVGFNLVETINVKSPVVSFQYESGFDAVPLGENTKIPVAVAKYGKVTLRTQKFGRGVHISSEAIEDVTSFDIVGRRLSMLMEACARYENNLIMKTLINGVSDGSTDFKTGQHVDNHILDATDTDWSGTSGKLDWEKIQTALAIGTAEGIPYDTLVVHPFVLVQLLQMEQFMSNNVWQFLPPDQQRTFRTSQMYPIAGLNIISTPYMDTDKALFLNTKKYAIRFVNRPLRTSQESIISHDSMVIYATARVGVGVVNPDAACRIDNLTPIDPSNYIG